LIAGSEADQSVNETVFERLHQAVEDRLHAGSLTVVDATNTEWMQRTQLVAQGRRCGRPVVAIVLDLPQEVCLARNAARPRRVRPGVVRQQLADLRHTGADLDLEGFAAVYRLRSETDVEAVRIRVAS
jgi:protein phosphatase